MFGMQLFKDSINSDKTCIVFHSTKASDLASLLLKDEFITGRGGGKMLGAGFYCNQHLYQAKKHNYGPYILKASIVSLDNFIFGVFDMFQTYFGDITWKGSLVTADNFMDYQAEKFGLPIANDYKFKSGLTSAKYFLDVFKGKVPSGKRKKPMGLVYFGDYDKESIVVWYPANLVIPLAVSKEGDDWTEVDQKFIDEYSSNLKSKKVHESF